MEQRSQEKTKTKSRKLSSKAKLRLIYIAIVILLTLVGLSGNETVEPLIRAVKEAFSILLII